jgi:hypothetical protein
MIMNRPDGHGLDGLCGPCVRCGQDLAGGQHADEHEQGGQEQEQDKEAGAAVQNIRYAVFTLKTFNLPLHLFKIWVS